MTSLTIGLLALAGAYLGHPANASRTPRLPWVLAGGLALLVFALAPRPFAEVLVWAVVALAVWLSYRGSAPVELMFTLAAGYLVGATSPYLDLTLGQYLDAPAGLGGSLATMVAVLAGLVLSGTAGAVMALLSASLSQGAFASAVSTSTVLSFALLAILIARSRPLLSSGLLFIAPLIGLLVGASV